MNNSTCATVRRLAISLLSLVLLIPTSSMAGTEPAGSMATARSSHVGVSLSDGRALVAGGFVSGSTGTATAEVFDPATATFSATGAMGTARAKAAAARLADGRVLVLGGAPTNQSPLPAVAATAEIYDPATGTWSATGSMATTRAYAVALTIADGRVLVIAGDSTQRSCELFDPATGTFSATGALISAREDFAASLLADGRVLVAGGSFLASAEIWDPATGTWTATGSMMNARSSATATRLADGRVLIAGGVTNGSFMSAVAAAEAFDPATGVFAPAGSLVERRSRHVAALFADGSVVVAGGYSGETASTTASLEIYDVATSTWRSAGKMTERRVRHAAIPLSNGELLIAGGVNGSELASAELVDPVCVGTPATITPADANYPASGGSGSIAVTHGAGCSWRATSVASWVTITSGGQGIGNGTVNYTVAENTSSFGRGYTISVADNSHSVSQASNPCGSATLSPTSQSFSSSGGSATVTLTAGASCTWTVSGAPSWVTITSSGTGSATISYSVATNLGAARSATLTIAGKTLSISQSANSCFPAPTISPPSLGFAYGGGTSTVSVTAPPACTWTVSGKPAWVSMATSGTGNATLNVTAASNAGAERSATFSVAGNSLSVTQTGNPCVGATLSPTSASYPNSAGSGAITLSADAACTWSVSGAPSWITVTSGASGTGGATISYTVAANIGASRSATLTIAGATHSVSQSAGSCWGATVSPTTSPTIPSAGGNGSVTVNAPAGCTWSVTSAPAWVTVTSATPVTGSGTVTYTVAANSGSARTGALIAAGVTHTVSQAGVTTGYCTSRGTTSSYEWIQSVAFNGVTRSSGNNGGYGDFTGTPTVSLVRGSNPFTLAPGFSSGSYSENWRIWIDFNKDNVFSDSELVYGGTSSGTIASSFTISSTPPSGATRMRVSMKWGSVPSACGNFSYGEVEDYLVTIP